MQDGSDLKAGSSHMSQYMVPTANDSYGAHSGHASGSGSRGSTAGQDNQDPGNAWSSQLNDGTYQEPALSDSVYNPTMTVPQPHYPYETVPDQEGYGQIGPGFNDLYIPDESSEYYHAGSQYNQNYPS